MVETLRLLRVFLASPGDLGEERLAARDAVKEINDLVARPAGYQVDLIGWEDTIAEARRAQAVINDDLDQCDVFVGMLHARWGTPPDKDGVFTSGFEEEYVRSRDRRAKTGKPDMKLYFKSVDSERIKDAGPELRRVLDFKEKLIEEKEVYFQSFEDPQDLARLMRASVASHIQKLIVTEASASTEELSQVPKATLEDERQLKDQAPIESHPDADFLQSLIGKISREEDVSATEVARARLIGASFQLHGNSDPDLGVHDANIIYAEAVRESLSWREMITLLAMGLSRFRQQTTPMWQWLTRAEARNPTILVFRSLFGEDRIRVGAIQALELLGREVHDDEYIERTWVIEKWFDKGVKSEIRNAAIRYLGAMGGLGDLEILDREISSANSDTVRSAIEAALSILLKYDADNSAKFVLESSFEKIDPNLLSSGLSYLRGLSLGELEIGLSHRNAVVRAATLARLSDMGQVDQDVLQRARADDSPAVRAVALSILDKSDSMPMANVVSILSKPRRTTNHLFIGSGIDEEAAKLVLEIKKRRFWKADLAGVEAVASSDNPDRDIAWLVHADRAFSAKAGELRSNLDDGFRAFVKSRWPEEKGPIFQGLLNFGPAPDERRRQSLIRSALDTLLERRESEDLMRLRSLIDEEAMPFARNDVLYLREIGGWEDIPRLGRIGSKKAGLFASEEPALEQVSVASILRLAKSREQELVALALPGEILAGVIALVADTVFAKWSNEVTGALLLHEHDSVRRVTALKMIKSFSKKRTRDLLAQYLSSDGQRYYNVIFWLDLIEAFPLGEARSIAARALKKGLPR